MAAFRFSSVFSEFADSYLRSTIRRRELSRAANNTFDDIDVRLSSHYVIVYTRRAVYMSFFLLFLYAVTPSNRFQNGLNVGRFLRETSTPSGPGAERAGAEGLCRETPRGG